MRGSLGGFLHPLLIETLVGAMNKLGDLDGAGEEVKSALKLDPENADLAKLKDN